MKRDPKTPGKLRHLMEWLRGRRKAEPAGPPEDPYAYRLAPVRPGPKGRSGAAAVAEPDEE